MSDHTEADDDATILETIRSEFNIGDVDTAEGQARRAEEAFLKSQIEDLKLEVEEMEDLPTPEEAELGELSRREPRSLTAEPPTFDELIDEDTQDLIEVHCQEIPKEASDEEVQDAIEDSEGILAQIENEFEEFEEEI